MPLRCNPGYRFDTTLTEKRLAPVTKHHDPSPRGRLRRRVLTSGVGKLLQKSEIERSQKSRESRFLDALLL